MDKFTAKSIEDQDLGEVSNKQSGIQQTPLLPIEGFPESIQNFILRMTEIYRTPRDYWAGAVIMSTALAIGDKIELATKYTNNPILWAMFVGDVSNGKTEPMDLCLRFFKKSDALTIKQYESEVAEYESLIKLSRKELQEQDIDEKPIKPKCFQYILIDSSPEALAEAHMGNERGIIIYRDELKGWIDDFGRYGKSGEQSNMLSMWSQKGVTYNRISSGIRNIKKPCILVTGGIHRELLNTLATDNRAENGFLARMVAFFPDNTEKQPYNNAIPDENLLRTWDDYLKHLTEIKEPIHLTLPEASAKLYENWFNQNVERINAEQAPYLKGVFGKLDIILLRVALVIRGMNYSCEGISSPGILTREMEAAVQITEYFRATALKVYHQIFGPNTFGTLEKNDIAVWLAKNTTMTKQEIANVVLKSSRSQLSRLIDKNDKKPLVVSRPK